jgi:hypothetical protein
MAWVAWVAAGGASRGAPGGPVRWQPRGRRGRVTLVRGRPARPLRTGLAARGWRSVRGGVCSATGHRIAPAACLPRVRWLSTHSTQHTHTPSCRLQHIAAQPKSPPAPQPPPSPGRHPGPPPHQRHPTRIISARRATGERRGGFTWHPVFCSSRARASSPSTTPGVPEAQRKWAGGL